MIVIVLWTGEYVCESGFKPKIRGLTQEIISNKSQSPFHLHWQNFGIAVWKVSLVSIKVENCFRRFSGCDNNELISYENRNGDVLNWPYLWNTFVIKLEIHFSLTTLEMCCVEWIHSKRNEVSTVWLQLQDSELRQNQLAVNHNTMTIF